MKKVYEFPVTDVMELSPSVILTGSVEEPNAGINPDDDVDAGDIESRRRNNVWDDEEDEEDDNYGYKY